MTITTLSNNQHFVWGYWKCTYWHFLSIMDNIAWTLVTHLFVKSMGNFPTKCAYKVTLDICGECLLTNTHVSQLLHELALCKVHGESLLGTKITLRMKVIKSDRRDLFRVQTFSYELISALAKILPQCRPLEYPIRSPTESYLCSHRPISSN